jgi:hypothetical protein
MRRVVRGVLATALLAGALGSAAAAPDQVASMPRAAAGEHTLPAVLPSAGGVKDPLFALLLGLIESDSYGTVSGERLKRELAQRPGRTRLPYGRVRALSRLPGRGGEAARVTVSFDSVLDLPIPYRILWYHPGRLGSSVACVFREWRVARLVVPPGGVTRSDIELRDVHLFGLDEGELQVDIDGWLDALMGGALDDTSVRSVALFRHGGRWLATALGGNKQGQPRSGTFDFAADRILFPTPGEMKAVARHVRPTLEALRR